MRETRLLALRPGALGDLVCALPLLAAVARDRPEWRVTVLGHAGFVKLAALLPGVEETADFGDRRFTGLFREEEPPDEDLVAFAGRFETALILARDPGGLLGRRLEACGIARILGLGERVPGEHEARRIGSVARGLGIGEPEYAGVLPLRLDRAGDPTLALLHPGSGSSEKCWPEARFASVAKALLDSGRRVHVLTGPADGNRAGALLARLGNAERLDAIAPPDVLALASALAAGTLFVGNDSGPAHLAGVLGLATRVVFGPTRPEEWAPCGPDVRALRASTSAGWPEAAEVLATILGLSPGERGP